MTTQPAAPLGDIVSWLDQFLQTESTPDYAGAVNGLQIEHTGPVRQVAAAVDASLRSVQDAVDIGANLLIVHHGLFWGGAQPIRGAQHRKLSLLLRHDIAVYSTHLPLDRHPTLGNNVLLAHAHGLTVSDTWLPYKGVAIGVVADTALPTHELAERARAFGRLHEHHTVITPFAADRMSRRIAICSGGGASAESLREARLIGADTLLVGEGPHFTAVDAEENGLVVIYAGHYATETLGVQALAQATGERWQLPWSFLPAPTGL
jgi:dinuclear metal center YbgI/SA1388 family protein